MNRCLFIALLLTAGLVRAQRFVGEGRRLSDFASQARADTVWITVQGLPPAANADFGLSRVCFHLLHPRVSDLKIELLSPSGASIWLTNRNGRDQGQDYVNTCFRSNGFSGYIHQGRAPFEGEYTPDGRFSFLNNGKNPNGRWALLITDLRAGEQGTLNYVTLEFSANPMPNNEQVACSPANPSGCQCPTGQPACELLPDLILLRQFTENQLKEYPKDDPHYPGQLRFAASIGNIGDGPMETLGRSEWYCGDQPADSLTRCPDGALARQRLYQRIYQRQGNALTWTDRVAGTNYFDEKPGHNHFHVDNWVEFRLIDQLADASGALRDTVLATGWKVSYCLFDSGICNNTDGFCQDGSVTYGEKNLINYGLGGYADCKSGKQGISVGGYDTYGMTYEGQFIQLPKHLKSGTYFLEIEIDPDSLYREKTRANNRLRLPVRITQQE